MMNYVSIQAGLGNQMFQYAFYLGLNAKGIKSIPVLSITDLGLYGYELERIFNIKIPCNLWTKSLSLIYSHRFFKLFELIHRTYKEKSYVFNSDIYSDSCLWYNFIFKGYWQSEKYFCHCKDEIRRAFKFSEDKLNKKTLAIAKNIVNINAISLHVRRGDYQSNEYFRKKLGSVCSLDYYKKAINYIQDKVESPLFVVFSDDINWVKANLKIENAIFVSHNKGDESWQDMYLMSKCKHNIIANSSFSWWGAWLNSNIDKIVVAPPTWWGEDKCEDVVPKSWIRL